MRLSSSGFRRFHPHGLGNVPVQKTIRFQHGQAEGCAGLPAAVIEGYILHEQQLEHDQPRRLRSTVPRLWLFCRAVMMNSLECVHQPLVSLVGGLLILNSMARKFAV